MTLWPTGGSQEPATVPPVSWEFLCHSRTPARGRGGLRCKPIIYIINSHQGFGKADFYFQACSSCVWLWCPLHPFHLQLSTEQTSPISWPPEPLGGPHTCGWGLGGSGDVSGAPQESLVSFHGDVTDFHGRFTAWRIFVDILHMERTKEWNNLFKVMQETADRAKWNLDSFNFSF